MKKNIGRPDKIIRIFIGVLIIILGASLNSVWGVLGMIPIISADLGICPLYLLFGVNTALRNIKKIK
jgi:hypothetical protein